MRIHDLQYLEDNTGSWYVQEKWDLVVFLKGDYTTGTRSHLGHRKTATGMKKDEKDDQDSNNLVTILTFNRLLVRSTTSFGFQHQGFGRSVSTNIFQINSRNSNTKTHLLSPT